MDSKEEAVQRACAAVARADADVEYWMQKYKSSVEEMREWAAAMTPEEAETAPRYRLLQKTLEDTRCGLDYSVRNASDARQELASARQFCLNMQKTRTEANATGEVAAEEPEEAVSAAPPTATDGGVNFRIRTTAETTSLPSMQQTLVSMTTSTAAKESGDVRQREGSGDQTEDGKTLTGASAALTDIQVASVKRGREIAFLVAPKRTKYLKTFEWPDKSMHHFPKDFTIPVVPLATMWMYWLCGDESARYPPFRILTAPELEENKTKRTLSSLRFVMIEIESRILAKGTWVNNPSPRDAADMLDTVKESIGVRPPAKRGELQPIEQLQWTSMGRIFRDQKKMNGEEDDDE